MSLHVKGFGIVAIPVAIVTTLILACSNAPASTPGQPATAPTASARGAAQSAPGGDVAAGEKVFNAQGCGACHIVKGAGGQVGPKLDGLYGSKVKLTSGAEVVADDAYIRESIVKPGDKVAAGYQPIMPGTYTSLSDQDLRNLVSFIASLR